MLPLWTCIGVLAVGVVVNAALTMRIGALDAEQQRAIELAAPSRHALERTLPLQPGPAAAAAQDDARLAINQTLHRQRDFVVTVELVGAGVLLALLGVLLVRWLWGTRGSAAPDGAARSGVLRDDVTALPGRDYLLDWLGKSLAVAYRQQCAVPVLFIEMTQIEELGSSLGRIVRDCLLVEVALRLRGCLRAEDFVAHLGSGQFVIVLAGSLDDQSVVYVTNRIWDRLTKVPVPSNSPRTVSALVGRASFPSDGETAEELIAHARRAASDTPAVSRLEPDVARDDVSRLPVLDARGLPA
jgi:diguanylate cyclase (GGDEF)-like protein